MLLSASGIAAIEAKDAEIRLIKVVYGGRIGGDLVSGREQERGQVVVELGSAHDGGGRRGGLRSSDSTGDAIQSGGHHS